MINVVQQEAKIPISHTLEINQINLPTHVEPPSDDGAKTCCWTIPLLTFNAPRASVREQLAHWTRAVTHKFSNAGIQCPTFVMVWTMRRDQVCKNPLDVGHPLERVPVDNLVSDLSWEN
jgi:hypothetical protein